MSASYRAAAAAVAVLLLTSVGPLAAQSLTGPGKEAKPTRAYSATAPSLGATDWLYWSEDEILERFLYAPLKPEGLEPYRPSRHIGLEAAMAKVDARIRDTLAAMARGSMSEQAARDTIEGVLLEYALFLGGLASQR